MNGVIRNICSACGHITDRAPTPDDDIGMVKRYCKVCKRIFETMNLSGTLTLWLEQPCAEHLAQVTKTESSKQ